MAWLSKKQTCHLMCLFLCDLCNPMRTLTGFCMGQILPKTKNDMAKRIEKEDRTNLEVTQSDLSILVSHNMHQKLQVNVVELITRTEQMSLSINAWPYLIVWTSICFFPIQEPTSSTLLLHHFDHWIHFLEHFHAMVFVLYVKDLLTRANFPTIISRPVATPFRYTSSNWHLYIIFPSAFVSLTLFYPPPCFPLCLPVLGKWPCPFEWHSALTRR